MKIKCRFFGKQSEIKINELVSNEEGSSSHTAAYYCHDEDENSCFPFFFQ